MTLHVHFDAGDLRVDEVLRGETPEAIVRAMQARVAQELGFLKGAVVRAMSPLGFAQEVTRRYNDSDAASGTPSPIPQTCAAFLQFGVAHNFATVLEGGEMLSNPEHADDAE